MNYWSDSMITNCTIPGPDFILPHPWRGSERSRQCARGMDVGMYYCTPIVDLPVGSTKKFVKYKRDPADASRILVTVLRQ
jgi:hypothetical protein